MIGYPSVLLLLDRLFKFDRNKVLENFYPSVCIMVVAHNEEKTIKEKIENLSRLNYPSNLLNIIVSSDNSTDDTNKIVRECIKQDPKIKLYEVKKRAGKTNAQNEAQKLVTSEILVMTDANSMLHKDSIINLVKRFSSEDISYVCGNLCYSNSKNFLSSSSESKYWDLEKKIRDIESRVQTITAGNGALYAVRNNQYFDIPEMFSHDFYFPLVFALNNTRSIYASDALAFEKAGESIMDEYKRKVRMNRKILSMILPSVKILNLIKYKWFTFFYLGHRTCRYLLWLSHLLLFCSSIFLLNKSMLFNITFLGQVLCFTIGLLAHLKILRNRVSTIIYYYLMTCVAQFHGVYNIIVGKSKPFWEKAESTR